MKATITNPSHLKDVLKLIIGLAPECRVVFDNGMMRISMMEVAGAAHVLYEHKNCEISAAFTADVLLEHFVQAFKNAPKDQPVTVTLVGGGMLVVEYDKPRYTRYQMPLLDEIRMIGKEPSPDAFDSLTLAPTKQLQDAIEEASQVGTEVLFVSGETTLTLKATAEVGLRACEMTIEAKEHNSRQPCSALYSAKYLESITSVPKIYETVVVRFSDDYPLELAYTDKDSYLRFILGPRTRRE